MKDSHLITQSAKISFGPISISSQERGQELQVRISAPSQGDKLPIILLAHGFGKSMRDYAPLVDFWVENGFAVIQPTFLDSFLLGLAPTDPRTPNIWKYRVSDMVAILDNLKKIEASVPGLADRLDTERIAAVGHSYGGQTVGMLLGAKVVGTDGLVGEDMTDPRIKVGILLSTTGLGGEFLTPFASENFGFMSPSFDNLNTTTLVIAGDNDDSPLSTRGPDWFTDVYNLSPGAKALVSIYGGEHLLGGITGYNVTDTTDENPQKVEAVQLFSTAYIKSHLFDDNSIWLDCIAESKERLKSVAGIQQK